MGTFIHPRSFRVKQIHFVAYLGARQLIRAVPQGAASLSLAVLESDGRKREGTIGIVVNWHVEIAETKPKRPAAVCPTTAKWT